MLGVYSTVATVVQFQQVITASDQAIRASDDFKIEQAKKSFLAPFKPRASAGQKVVDREIVDEIRNRISDWDGTTTIIAGLHEAGKTWALEQACEGVQGVFCFRAEDAGWEKALYSALGVTGEGMMEKVLLLTKEELSASNPTQVPIIVLDVPRGSKADVRDISCCCKAWVIDGRLAHVIVLASSATVALGFDSGEDLCMWVDDFTDSEAMELLGTSMSDEGKRNLVQNIGCNGGNLAGAAIMCKNSVSIDDVVAKSYNKAREDIMLLLNSKPCKEIIKSLMSSPLGVKHEQWLRVGITVSTVAKQIEELEANGIFFHTVERKWKFASPAHLQASHSLLDNRKNV